MKLCLGVTDMPYDFGNKKATTHEVATFLEDKYSLFTLFYQAHQKEILEEVRTEVVNQISNAINRGAPLAGFFILNNTNRLFTLFIELEEMAGLSVNVGPGLHNTVPTMASEMGVNSRLKKKTGVKRPSFVDSGTFLGSFVAWVDFDD